ETAAEAHAEIWLVGGLVRDLLLDRPTTRADLDLAVEGDAGSVARRLAGRLGGRVREHPSFLTATVELSGGRRIDLATARRERYARPGALPQVEAASLREDLWRRDFAVNALAVRLRPGAREELLDPTGGREDLERKEIRVLHPLSFVEDPTRIFRAVRFAERLGFRLERATRHLLVEAARFGGYDMLAGERLRTELGRTLAEPGPEAVLEALGRLGGLRLLGPDYRFTGRVSTALDRVRRRARRLPLEAETREGLVVLALTDHGRGGHPAAWWRRLGLPARSAAALTRARAEAPAIRDRVTRAADPGAAYESLRGTPELTLAWALVGAAGARPPRYLAAHLATWRHARPLLGGDDLRALGLRPGPRFGALLRGLTAEQVAGRVRTRAQATRWLAARAGLARRPPPSPRRATPPRPSPRERRS
ncbi:MAG: hypothetical protein DMD79_26875, partial [Candidatus Rokuibacteriota bacterium]